MPFVGNTPSNNYTSFAKQDLTGASGGTLTLSTSVANENEIQLFINHVRQEPATSYTVSGTTVTLQGYTVSASDDIYVMYSGKALQTVVPPDGSVSSAKLDTNIAIAGDLTVDTSTLKVDSSNNRVGIGTSPSHPLHILTSTDGTGVSGDNIWAALVVNAEATDGRSYGLKISAGSTTDQAFAITDHDGSNDLLWVEGNGTTKYRTNAAAGVYGVTITANNSQSDIGISGSGTGNQHRIKFFNTNGQVGAINTSGSATSYNTSSDYRLKENVTTSWDATSRLQKLKPSRFNFKTDKDTTVDGFLAHEVSSVVPEAITGEKDAKDADGNPIMQSIDQSKLVPLLVKTIQELEARITKLEGK